MDFITAQTKEVKHGNRYSLHVYPVFSLIKSKDLMIKGGEFYAMWDEPNKCWTTSLMRAYELIDLDMREWIKQHPEVIDEYGANNVIVESVTNSEHRYASKFVSNIKNLTEDNYHNLNQTVMFSNSTGKRDLYSTFSLPYALEPGKTTCYDELMSTLYSDEESRKIEWAIGSVISGDSKKIQKFFVFYGEPGSGKSTVLNIIQGMFDGYWTSFSAKALGGQNDFALEPLKDSPLIGIEHDADLSRITSNIRLNSVISHESMSVNVKHRSMYVQAFTTMLFVGTNSPVRITDSKSGLIRRLIDIRPSGKKLSEAKYKKAIAGVKFEYGAIAAKCLDVYKNNKHIYDNYIPYDMMGATNQVYNFFLDNSDTFLHDDADLKQIWKMYTEYVEQCGYQYKLNLQELKEDAKQYFREYHEQIRIDYKLHRKRYVGFLAHKFFGNILDEQITDREQDKSESNRRDDIPSWLHLIDWKEEYGNASGGVDKPPFDILCADCPAQLCNDDGNPKNKWDKVKTTLKEVDAYALHFVRVPVKHIVIDFDIRGEDGQKSLELNLKAASKWPKTYAEVSKSGQGLHLHYIYTGGDPTKLSRVYEENVEIKVYSGKSALRRKLTLCNGIDISTINSGLPLKEENKVVINKEGLKNEKALRTFIMRNLAKEYHADTASSVNFIFKGLEDAYNSGITYDVTDLRPAIFGFASQSTNQSERCLRVVDKMKWHSKDVTPVGGSRDVPDDPTVGEWTGSTNSEFSNVKKDAFIFFDVEVFPNLFVVVWKPEGGDAVSWINPTPDMIEDLCKYRLIGFNNRAYDNHILYARMMGYSNEQLYILSQRLIGSESKNATFGPAYNLSYTDVYDFASAGNKMSLKKWEIKLNIHHLELGLKWDKPVPEELWPKVAKYCINDVVSTEAVFNYLKGDFMAREILADIAGGTPNDTTNSLTTKFIWGKERNTKEHLVYTDLSEMFPGYKFEYGKSTYRGETVGEGGYVYAEPGIYRNVALIDVASMHPSSIENLNLFGDYYTKRFSEIKQARVYIKHKDWDKARSVLDGKLSKYIDQALQSGDKSIFKALSTALKTAINSVYGLTSAGFDNKFKDPRNVDNIVAKRGALFMLDLKHAVQERGFTVAHIKTDSIKIPDATPEIIEFVMEFGRKYGYSFEHEATYERMCLINDAVYIARYTPVSACEKMYGYSPEENVEHGGLWTPTGARFADPFIFKTLFSHAEVEFPDLCVTKSVQTSMYLDCNEGLPEGEHDYRFVGKVGSFVPVVDGVGGGILLREKSEKQQVEGKDPYASVGGTKGYRWLEAEVVKEKGLTSQVDYRYFRSVADDAIAEINKYGDFDDFIDVGVE